MSLSGNPPLHLRDLSFYSKIDFDRIDLPSSRLTLGQLRKRFPDRAGHVLEDEGMRLDTLGEFERTAVAFGYASVLGKEAEGEVGRQCIEPDKAQLVRSITEELVYYGLADGPLTAVEIVKGLEQAGAEMAREQLGHSVP